MKDGEAKIKIFGPDVAKFEVYRADNGFLVCAYMVNPMTPRLNKVVGDTEALKQHLCAVIDGWYGVEDSSAT